MDAEFCFKCQDPGPCDMHCAGCSRDVFLPEVESFRITRWDPKAGERELVAVLCSDCMPVF